MSKKDVNRLQGKIGSMEKVSRKDVQAQLDRIQGMIVKANAFKAVTGGIPDSVIGAIESALNVVVPLTAFLGDFELTTLLSSLQVWLQKKKAENAADAQQAAAMQSLSYGDYWTY